MKNLLRSAIIVITVVFMAGVLGSCSSQKSAPKATVSFKHKKPLPKKYIVTTKRQKTVK